MCLRKAAECGKKIVVLVDDAYYGLWYDKKAMGESIAGVFANIHPNVLTVRVDGATKEYCAGGLRVGFISFMGQPQAVLDALALKTAGAVRAYLSSTSRPAQELVLRILKSNEIREDFARGMETLRMRGETVMSCCQKGSSHGLWQAYPFRGGYFVCLRMQNAYAVRNVLLSDWGIGTVAINQTDLRISYPCLEKAQIETLFDLMDEAVLKVNAGGNR